MIIKSLVYCSMHNVKTNAQWDVILTTIIPDENYNQEMIRIISTVQFITTILHEH